MRVFTIGSGSDKSGGAAPLLGSLPVGWRFGEEGEGGTEIVLDPSSTTQPSGWVPGVFGSGLYSLEWAIPFGDAKTPEIAPGESLAGFSVTVPEKGKHRVYPFAPKGSGDNYYRGSFEAGFPTGSVFGRLEPLDVTPPVVQVQVSRALLWPANGELVPIKVSISAKDDFDPTPAVKLESITANESLGPDDVQGAREGTSDGTFKLRASRAPEGPGRIYTITYSVTDGTGNRSKATATVQVPRDPPASAQP